MTLRRPRIDLVAPVPPLVMAIVAAMALPACVPPVDCDNACSGATPHCDVNTGYCVECLEAAHCPDPTKPACSSDGVCGCTVDADCGGKSCAVLDGVCTTTTPLSVQTCEPCRSDSECVADHRCVPMNYQGTPRPNGYCLKLVSATCERPYGTPINRGSLSDPNNPLAHCGIPESVTTCDAVLDLIHDTSCTAATAAEDCGDPLIADDGRCETVGTFPDRCTYSCVMDAECPNGVCKTYCGAP